MSSIRQRAKDKGLECTLTKADLVNPGVCPVFGTKLVRSNTGFDDASPSVDRVDNTKGYTPKNVRVISNRANKIKGTATLDELKALVAYMERELNASH